jgi:mono/diheme cytochrome c family protein
MRKLGTDIPVMKAEAALPTPAARNPFNDLAAIKGEAESLYNQHCASCHGEKREGTLGPDLRGSSRPDAELFTIISHGIEANGMPAFGGTLDERKIWQLVTLIKLGSQ